MQGIFVDGGQRPKSKKQIKELAAERPGAIYVEATSLIGNEFGGAALDMDVGHKIYFVGPDPYTRRKFYGTIERTEKGLKVS